MECVKIASAGNDILIFFLNYTKRKFTNANCCSQTEELIGLEKHHVPCLSPDCPSEYSINDLQVFNFIISIYRVRR